MGMAILIFILNILITVAVEKNEFNFKTLFLVIIMLFTYSKLWVFVVLNAIVQTLNDVIFKREVNWYKTERPIES